MAEPLTPELLTEWRQTSLDCPQPISLDRMVIELVGEVFHLRTQRDQLHEANNRLLEERRASGIEASEWQEAARLRCIDADEAKGELAAAHTQLGEWRESVVAANRISQGFEARALAAEAEVEKLKAERTQAFIQGRDRENSLRAQRDEARADCAEAPRPCPFVGCKWHLYLDVTEVGSITYNFPGKELWDLEETCSLDVADRCGTTLERVGDLVNVTRERIRQLELRGLQPEE